MGKRFSGCKQECRTKEAFIIRLDLGGQTNRLVLALGNEAWGGREMGERGILKGDRRPSKVEFENFKPP